MKQQASKVYRKRKLVFITPTNKVGKKQASVILALTHFEIIFFIELYLFQPTKFDYFFLVISLLNNWTFCEILVSKLNSLRLQKSLR